MVHNVGTIVEHDGVGVIEDESNIHINRIHLADLADHSMRILCILTEQPTDATHQCEYQSLLYTHTHHHIQHLHPSGQQHSYQGAL